MGGRKSESGVAGVVENRFFEDAGRHNRRTHFAIATRGTHSLTHSLTRRLTHARREQRDIGTATVAVGVDPGREP